MLGLNYLFPLKNRNQRRAAGHPSRAGVTLNLEALEERWLPNGAGMAAIVPPSFLQAAVTLYIDGIRSEAFAVANFAAFQDNFATASMAERLYQFLGNADYENIQANIAFMEPYAAPFGQLFVQAGEQAADQFLGPIQNHLAAPAGDAPAGAL